MLFKGLARLAPLVRKEHRLRSTPPLSSPVPATSRVDALPRLCANGGAFAGSFPAFCEHLKNNLPASVKPLEHVSCRYLPPTPRISVQLEEWAAALRAAQAGPKA